MINPNRLFSWLENGLLPESNALDEAIVRFGRKKTSRNEERLLDEMIRFLEGNADSNTFTFAEDENVTLSEHDSRYHPDGFNPEKESCGLRDRYSSADKTDMVSGGDDKGVKGSADVIPGISNKRRREYEDLMRRKHPNIDAGGLLRELGKIGNRKVQGDAFRWAIKGAARLPEDLYKIEEARRLADKAKKDPLSYDTPQACIDDIKGSVKVRDGAIDPDTVKELYDKRVLPLGVTTYAVRDDLGGLIAMRKIIDTHWGEDANPWCLLARDEDGGDPKELTEALFEKWWDELPEDEKENFTGEPDEWYGEPGVSASISSPEEEAKDFFYLEVLPNMSYPRNLGSAWGYWNKYNALPKRVAFKDGRLLAFMATDDDYVDLDYADQEISEWLKDNRPEIYDEFDKSDEYGAYSFLNENYPEVAEDVFQELGRCRELWWDRQDMSHNNIPVGNIPVPGDRFGRWAYYKIVNGKAVRYSGYQKGSEGRPGFKEWYDNGLVAKEVLKDGHARSYYQNGQPRQLWSDKLGGAVFYHDNGNVMEIVDNRNSGMSAGVLLSSDGKILRWTDSGGSGLQYGKTEESGNPDRWQLKAMLDYIPEALRLRDMNRQTLD